MTDKPKTRKIWRDPNGRHWEETGTGVGDRFDEENRRWMHDLTPAQQDPETGRWAAIPSAAPIETASQQLRDEYTEVSDNPLADPRIAHLHTLTTELLADYEQHTGRAHPRTAELRLTLEDVAYIPKEARRRRVNAVMQARRH